MYLHGLCPLCTADDLDQSIPKDDSMCIIPECTRPKFRDPKTGKEHECCGKSHAEEAKKRDIKRKLYTYNVFCLL